jgi:hypothetical protein
LEAHAAWQATKIHGHVARWDDLEQATYERLLVETLKLVHRARWRKAISKGESDTILATAASILGPAAACPGYAEKMPALEDQKDKPNSRQSLAAILGMLDALAKISPEIRDRFMARTGPPPYRHGGR